MNSDLLPTYQVRTDDPQQIVAVGALGERTVGDLLRDVSQLRRTVIAARPDVGEQGSSPSARITVVCQDRYFFTVALLAAWELGAIAVLPPNLQRESLQADRTSGVGCVFHDGLPGARGFDVRNSLPSQAGDDSAISFRGHAHDRVLVAFQTSGTTGAAQPITKTAHQLFGEAKLIGETFAISSSDRVLATVPPNHIYGLLFSVLMPLLSGGSFVRSSPLYPETIAELLRSLGSNVLVSVPAHLCAFALLSPEGLTKPDRVFCSGAPLPTETAIELESKFGFGVTEVFGSTETGGIGWRLSPANDVFQPFDGVTMSADSAGNGLLVSPFTDSSSPTPLVCADRVESLVGGGFRHLGRSDDIVKVAGTRVSLDDVVQRLRALEGVQDAAAIAVEAPTIRGVQVEAFVVAAGRDAGSIRTELKPFFDPVVLPRIRVVQQLPHTPYGKMPRSALMALLERIEQGERGNGDIEVIETRDDRTDAGLEFREVDLSVPADCPYFEGHFPESAILPGVVQLHTIALRHTRAAWPDLSEVSRVSRLRFKIPIRREYLLTLGLRRKPESRAVTFQIRWNEKVCSSGFLEFSS